jgi:hypothetical protein
MFVMKKVNLEIVQKFLFAILIFLIPSNLFKTFLENSAYVKGLSVDYLIPKFYLSDLILFLLLIALLLVKKNRQTIKTTLKNIWQNPLLTMLIIVLILFQLTVLHPIISFLFLIRLLGLIMLGCIINKNKQILNSTATQVSIQISLIFQSFLAWYQFLNQKSLFNYYFLGETNLNSYAGIARSSISGAEQILPYGTTAHPNVLAGILVIFALIQLNYLMKNKKYQRPQLFIFLLAVSTIILTQSLSAILALLVGLATLFLVKKFKKKISIQNFSLIFLIGNLIVITFLASNLIQLWPNSTSLLRRAFLNQASINMLSENIFTGVGLQNFTANVEKYSFNREVVRFVQPAHNILMLGLAETGMVGVMIILWILIPILKKNTKIKHPEYLMALIPIAILDHYLISLQSGLLLVALSFWFTVVME